MQLCNIIVDGGWSEWSSYTNCNVTCGTGSQTRSRECDSPVPSYGGTTCAGESTGTVNCQMIGCPGMSSLCQLIDLRNTWIAYDKINFISINIHIIIVDGLWSDWSAYTDCNVTCGSGTQIRRRDCNSPTPVNGGSNCTGDASETRDCEESPCSGMPWFTRCICFDIESTQFD